jgi:hypothetical protein
VHQQAQLIDQPRGEQLLHHGDRAGDEDAFDAGIGLERGHGLDEVAGDQLGVAPGELQRLTRDDHFAYVPELLGERRVLSTRPLALGPRPGEAVVCHASDEQHVGGVVVLGDGTAHVLVEIGEVPVGVDLGHTVGRDEQSGDDLCHRDDPLESSGVPDRTGAAT